MERDDLRAGLLLRVGLFVSWSGMRPRMIEVIELCKDYSLTFVVPLAYFADMFAAMLQSLNLFFLVMPKEDAEKLSGKKEGDGCEPGNKNQSMQLFREERSYSRTSSGSFLLFRASRMAASLLRFRK